MRRPPLRGPRALAGLIAGIGIVLTCAGSWALARVDASSEQRLLRVQTAQAASVLSTAIMLLEQPLATALSVQQIAGAGGSGAFADSMAPYVGPGKAYGSASLWRRRPGGLSQVATTGAPPTLGPDSVQARSLLRDAFGTAGPIARPFTVHGRNVIVWARGDLSTGLAVYAERNLPPGRRSSVDTDSAYAGLHYAMYLGRGTEEPTLLFTDLDPASLPMSGDTARQTVKVGDSDLTLVASARTHLGSTLSRWLPLGVLVGGLILTVLAAFTGWRLGRRHRDVEEGATTITRLYEQVELLYGQQRELFERLQRALLPSGDMKVPGLEVAAQYVSGSQGTEIGGDWYSLIALDEDRFAFVVGDVSGRGIDTVAVMARARFTLRAYLLDGHEPATALEKCSRHFDIAEDGHLTTVVAGVGNTRTGELRIANAGHPPPFLLDGEPRPVQVPPGRPLGLGTSSYTQATFRLDPGETLFCYTDGLVERRHESIDVGLDRLAATLSDGTDLPVDALVAHALDTMRCESAGDDIAALALRRVGTR